MEYDAFYRDQTNRFFNLGDLLDAQNSEQTTSNARKLDLWNAGADNLGCLLNLIGGME